MRLLPFGVCLGDAGTWLAQPKAQLPEQALALPYPQVDPILFGNPGRQRFAIPQVPAQSYLSWHLAKSDVDSQQMLLVEAAGSPGALTFPQSGQASFFEAPHPILDRPRSITQEFRDFRTRHALRHEQHTVKLTRCLIHFRQTAPKA